MLFLFSQGVIFTKWKVIWTPDQGSLRNWHPLWLTIATSSSQGGQLIMKASSFWFWSWLGSWGQKWELKKSANSSKEVWATLRSEVSFSVQLGLWAEGQPSPKVRPCWEDQPTRTDRLFSIFLERSVFSVPPQYFPTLPLHHSPSTSFLFLRSHLETFLLQFQHRGNK